MKYIVSSLWASLVPLLWWFGGYNFDARGADAVACATLTVFVFLFVLAYPGWRE
jgi:hypothetical protein